MTILTTVPYLNPFIMNDRQITNIIFYNDEGILFETHRGWFGYGNNVFKSFDLVDEVKVRRITALNKLDKKEIRIQFLENRQVKNMIYGFLYN